MAHPNKAEGIKGHNAKLRRMTRDYGDANPSMKKEARVNFPKHDGPEDDPGFGVDAAGATPRADRPARRAAPGNAVASLKRGGHVKGKRRAPGGGTFNYGQNDMAASQKAMQQSQQQNKAQQPNVGAMMKGLGATSSYPSGSDPSAKRGGRVRHRADGGGLSTSPGKSARKGGKSKTNISINITPASPPTGVSGLPSGANPALPPPMPPRPPVPMMPPGAGAAGPPPGMGPGLPPGGPPGMPPGAPGPLGQLALQQKAAGLLPRKRGGRIPHDDEAADTELVKDMVKQSALKGRAKGGSVLKGAGAESGEGRLNRNRHMGHLGVDRASGGSVLKAAGAESGPGRLNRNRHMDHKLKPTTGVAG